MQFDFPTQMQRAVIIAKVLLLLLFNYFPALYIVYRFVAVIIVVVTLINYNHAKYCYEVGEKCSQQIHSQ